MDIPRLDSWSLHCLVVLVSESNVTRAGAALDLSQPAASAILARLRELFQDPILVKSSSGMIPTPRALEAAARAERILDDIREIVRPPDPAFDPYRYAGNVSLAAADVIRLLALPPLVKVLQHEAPELVLTVHNADRIRIHERLERADIDLGLGPEVVSTGRLHYKELWRDEAVCLTRKGTGAERASLDVAEFAELGHIRIVPSRPSFYDDLLEKELFGLGLRRRIVVAERSFLMLPSLIAASDLIAIVPKRFAAHACSNGELEAFPVPVRLAAMSLGLYWHERTHREPLFRWLRTRIATALGPNIASWT